MAAGLGLLFFLIAGREAPALKTAYSARQQE
jgi:hypothetical protein